MKTLLKAILLTIGIIFGGVITLLISSADTPQIYINRYIDAPKRR